jgi:ribonuclease R
MNIFNSYIKNKVHPKYSYKHKYSCSEESYYNIEHSYNIKEWSDLTYLECYSIDPECCRDVDDAFSVWFEENGDKNEEKSMYMGVHIADPTAYFSPECEIFSSIQKNSITHYPSNKAPLHMMPRCILKSANLMVDENSEESSELKRAVSVIFTINKETFLPIDYKIIFGFITVKRGNKLSYDVKYNVNHDVMCNGLSEEEKAREDAIYYGLRISDAVRKKRNSAIESIVNYNKTSITYNEKGEPMFKNASESGMMLKIMIEEFAILANGAVGSYLYEHSKGVGFYRSCIVDSENIEILREKSVGSGVNALQFIINNGIQAFYNKESGEHSLVNTRHYTHFTSPLRRFTDCVTHFMLKAFYMNKESPFSVSMLDNMSNYSNKIVKLERNIQFEDKKINTLWGLRRLVEKCSMENIGNGVFIRVKFMGYVRGFLNFLIYNVVVRDTSVLGESSVSDEVVYYIHMSYTVRVYDYKYLDRWNKKDNCEIQINEVNCITKFDVGILPELETLIVNGNIC